MAAVTTTTLSRQQYEYTRQRIAEQGLEDRITLLLEDYATCGASLTSWCRSR